MILSTVVTFLGLLFSFATGSALAWIAIAYCVRCLMHSLNRDAAADTAPTTISFTLRKDAL
jgi:hypothetical protein